MTPAVAYWDEPEQVIWVDVGHRRLQGFDYYWTHGRRYGCFNDPANRDAYDGRQLVAWEHRDGVETETDPTVPAGATLYTGFQLTDDQARAVGLL